MHTPLFPAFRSRLAALGRRTVPPLRQTTLADLQQWLRDFLPAPLLSRTDEGPNSRDRIFSLGLTLECFLWQMLKPHTACREVVRQVQTLCTLAGWGIISAGDSAYVQARQRLPKERLEMALTATAQAADRRVGAGASCRAGPSKWWMAHPPNRRTPPAIKSVIRSLPPKSAVVAFRHWHVARP